MNYFFLHLSFSHNLSKGWGVCFPPFGGNEGGLPFGGIKGDLTIDVSSLPSGMYFLKTHTRIYS